MGRKKISMPPWMGDTAILIFRAKLAVLSTGLNLEAEEWGLLSLDFSDAYRTANRKVIVDIWLQIFPVTRPFVQSMHAIPPTNVSGRGQTGQRPATSLWKKEFNRGIPYHPAHSQARCS